MDVKFSLTDLPVSSSKFFQALPGRWQAQLLATVGMAVLPPTFLEDPNAEIVTYVPEALHFRRFVVSIPERLERCSPPLEIS